MHASQPVAPGSSWKEPAAQLKHAGWLAFGLNVPGAQSLAVAAPTEQYVPAPHTTH